MNSPRMGSEHTREGWNLAGRLPGCVLAAAVLASFVGCGERGPQLAPISGVVTLDGEPLANAVINFQPVASASGANPGVGSSARTDSEGRFVLETIDGKPGAVVGPHKVKIFSYSPESPVASDVDTEPTVERVPEEYNYRSKLIFEVPAGGDPEARFDLTT